MEDEWSDEELGAAVDAYRRMQQDVADGRAGTKKRVYDDLAAQFGRSPKAYEYRMQNISSVLEDDGQDWVPGWRPAKNVGPNVEQRIRALLARADLGRGPVRADRTTSHASGSRRLPVRTLESVSALHIWTAVQLLLEGASAAPFGPSTDYDLVTDDGRRLPPKAVFGIALSYALGSETRPEHFSGGVDSPCFRLLREAGFAIVSKGAASPDRGEPGVDPAEMAEWAEGAVKLVAHRRRERGAGLAKAKKEDFKAKNGGRLFCEKCGVDPVADYGTALAESCIEVHHAATMVRSMTEGHVTTLDDVQCLCANCHRLIHRQLAKAAE